MDSFSKPIVTSKVATDHYNDIIARRIDIVSGIRQQADKVALYNQTRAQEEAQRKTDILAQEKDRMANEQKNKELEIKRLALSS